MRCCQPVRTVGRAWWAIAGSGKRGRIPDHQVHSPNHGLLLEVNWPDRVGDKEDCEVIILYTQKWSGSIRIWGDDKTLGKPEEIRQTGEEGLFLFWTRRFGAASKNGFFQETHVWRKKSAGR